MISEQESIHISKFLSLVLRHYPKAANVVLDENGWTDVATLITNFNEKGVTLDIDILKYIVETNNKKRFAFNDTFDKIRASQGHSLDIDLGYKPMSPPEILYHGTALKSIDAIMRTGLKKQKRNHVHLSEELETAVKVGKRHGQPIVFEILAAKMHEAGHPFYLSANGVWLTENVPVVFLRLMGE